MSMETFGDFYRPTRSDDDNVSSQIENTRRKKVSPESIKETARPKVRASGGCNCRAPPPPKKKSFKIACREKYKIKKAGKRKLTWKQFPALHF
jgi:hypothetical protein